MQFVGLFKKRLALEVMSTLLNLYFGVNLFSQNKNKQQ